MVKAFSSGKNKAKQDDEQKSRKKQAKKEAKLMAQVDQARKDVRKAEQKATKAQTNLQEQQAHLYKLEQELAQFRQAVQVSSNEAVSKVNASDESDNAEIQLSSSAPAEGLTDRVQEDTTGSPEAASTPMENIPAGQFDEEPGAQVYADISINPPTEEELILSSGDGSIPVVTTDEHAWPPPQIREELAESIAEEIVQERQTTAENEQSGVPTATGEQAAHDNGHSAAEENFAITSGDGSMPVVTNDEHAWPPPQIREELAESIAEEVAQEHQTADNKQHESNESSTEEEAEDHEDEHQEGSSRPRRPTRRRTRSNTHQDTNKTDQE
jgi:hypothetical protein